MAPGTTQHFIAQALDNNNQAVSNVNYFWVVTAGGGTIDNTGIFTAGTAGTYNDTVEVIAVQGKTIKLATGSVIVAANSSPITYVTVTPANVKIALSGTQQFTAQGYDSNNVAIPNLTYVWTVAGTGSIDSSGLFTAGGAKGTATVTATTQTISGKATVTVTSNPTPTSIGNYSKGSLFSMLKGYLKNIGSDNFLGGQWQIKNSSGTIDTYKLISGVVQTASATSLTIIPNGQTAVSSFTLTSTSVIQPKNAVLAANDKVIVLTVNDQVTTITKITAISTTQLPPGLKNHDKDDNQQGNNTPPGWSHGKKTGWNK